ncbi:hypothetical protein BJ742DRAFT_774825 [Cladochytrium replicatum]|nr:hypothetical protein BJ742DRAFT_774825 [Cladochytrium replicatum]
MSNIFLRSPDTASARSVPLFWNEDLMRTSSRSLTDDLGTAVLLRLHCLLPILHEWDEISTLDRAYGAITSPAVAGELLNLLQSLGLIMSLSETLVGLASWLQETAWADLLTNINIAELGYRAMAVGVYFTSPMLNLVLGIGLTSLCLTLSRGETYELAPSRTIYFSSIGLLTVLGLSAVLVPLNDFRGFEHILRG